MDVGTLDVRRKPCPEGHYKGLIIGTTWKPVMKDEQEIIKGRMRIQILTDNPNSDESTKGKSVFDNLPWTEDMAWKFGVVYAAANDLPEDSEELNEMSPEKFEEGTKQKEVFFDVIHNTIVSEQTHKPVKMVNVQGYKTVETEG